MAYGILKCDTVTFTDGGVDKSVSISGLVQNPTFSGNITVTGTVSGNTIQGQTVSGVTVTGTTALFSTGTFISLTGTTSQGTTATYTSGSFTSLTGVTTSGTTANFVSGVFSTQISGATVTGNAGAFTTLTGGVTTITSGVFAAGSATNPSISFSSDTNTGIYSPGADQVAISTSGSGRAVIGATGRLGLGTMSPGVKVDILAEDNTSLNPVLRVNSNNVAVSTALAYDGLICSNQLTIGNTSSNPIIFNTNSSERLRITSAGLVGIGTSSPSSKLDVRDASVSQITSSVNGVQTAVLGSDTSTGAYTGTLDNYPYKFLVNGSVKATLTSTGLGIGTTSPGGKLVISDGTTTFQFDPVGGTGNILRSLTSGGSRDSLLFDASQYVYSNGATEYARIDSSGRLLVGTSSGPSDSTLVLQGNSSNSTYNSVLRMLRNVTNPAADAVLGTIIFGVGNAASSGIECYTDGQWGTNDYPGRLVFSTTADGASSPTERLRITSAGLVGIGTSGPLKKTEIRSTPTTADTDGLRVGDGTRYLEFAQTGATYNYMQVGANQNLIYFSGSNLSLSTDGANAITLNTNSLERVRVTSAGNVGIGTTTPTDTSGYGTTLDIRGSGTGNGGVVYLGNSDATVRGQLAVYGDGRMDFGTTTNHPLRFFTFNSERARIDSSGRLLVGTSSARTNVFADLTTALTPAHQVETVVNSSWSTGLSIINNSSSGFAPVLTLGLSCANSVGSNTLVPNGNTLGRINFAGNDGTNFVCGARIAGETDGTTGSGDLPSRLVFSTTADGASSPTERMRIGNDGRTSAFSASSTNTLTLSSAAAAGTTFKFIEGAYGATGVNTGTESFRVYTNGDVQNTNNSYGSISDIKLKENIVDANSQWDDIKALQVRNYNFKEGQTHTQIGLVAQEVELVSPGLVTESPDRDEDGNDLGTVTKSVNYSVLYMKAVKALQEAMERIETLEAKVAALKSA